MSQVWTKVKHEIHEIIPPTVFFLISFYIIVLNRILMTYAHTLEAAEAGALYGTPDEIAAKLQKLRDYGAEYVLLNSTGGFETLRRFAEEVRPAFASEPVLR